MDLKDIAPIIVIIVAAGVIGAIGAQITSTVQTSVTCTANTSQAYCAFNDTACCVGFPNVHIASGRVAQEAAANATSGIGQVMQWMPTIALVIAAAIIIGIIYLSMTGRDVGQASA